MRLKFKEKAEKSSSHRFDHSDCSWLGIMSVQEESISNQELREESDYEEVPVSTYKQYKKSGSRFMANAWFFNLVTQVTMKVIQKHCCQSKDTTSNPRVTFRNAPPPRRMMPTASMKQVPVLRHNATALLKATPILVRIKH